MLAPGQPRSGRRAISLARQPLEAPEYFLTSFLYGGLGASAMGGAGLEPDGLVRSDRLAPAAEMAWILSVI